MFQSSFELTGYITSKIVIFPGKFMVVSKLFRAYGLYNNVHSELYRIHLLVSKLFRAYGLYNLCSLEGA